jgi:hypothetical protein
MTENEWLTGTDPEAMLEFVRARAKERKLRLFACACCRGIWGLLTDPRSRRGVETAERFADGMVGQEALAASEAEAEVAISRSASGEPLDPASYAAWWTTAGYEERVGEIAEQTSRWVEQAVAETRGSAACDTERKRQCGLLREIFGNPCRPASGDPAWPGATALALAQAIYEEQTFERMPVLADALEEAGCADAEILGHCRGPGPHVRGCWVVDLVLGKK